MSIKVNAFENENIPKIWNVNRPNLYFAGRDAYIEEIYNKFNKISYINIYGPTAIGKSQIAKKYAHVYKNHYYLVWWFDCEIGLDKQFRKLF